MATNNKVQEQVEADANRNETATERLERLQAEAKAKIAEAKKAVKAEQAENEAKALSEDLDKIGEILAGIEEKTGKVFRTFSFRRKPDSADKIRYSLVKPRSES